MKIWMLYMICVLTPLLGCENFPERRDVFISYNSCVIRGLSDLEMEGFAKANAMQDFKDWPKLAETGYPNLSVSDALVRLAEGENNLQMKDLNAYRISILPSSDGHHTYVLYHPQFKILLIIYEDVPKNMDE